jgi:hypothetical protein
MSSKLKTSLFENEENTNRTTTTAKSGTLNKNIFSNSNLSPLLSKRRPPLSKLASLPFRYAFDGYRSSGSQLTKQNTIPDSRYNNLKCFSNTPMSAQEHFSSSSLSCGGGGGVGGQCNSSSHFGDYSTTSEIEISEENLNKNSNFKKQNSISSSDLDEVQILQNNEINNDNNESSENSKKCPIRRHHSAPQSDAKWLQVI